MIPHQNPERLRSKITQLKHDWLRVQIALRDGKKGAALYTELQQYFTQEIKYLTANLNSMTRCKHCGKRT